MQHRRAVELVSLTVLLFSLHRISQARLCRHPFVEEGKRLALRTGPEQMHHGKEIDAQRGDFAFEFGQVVRDG